MRMSWRLASRLSVITLALLVVVIVAFWGLRNGNGGAATIPASANSSGLQGTDLGSLAAPDFRLKDQFGKPISLSQFRGKTVVLTFLYTHCPDVCPLTAEKLHATQEQLGNNAAQVVMLAVSTDPKGDTPSTAQHFSQEHKLSTNWHYLLGTHSDLAPIWNAYSVYAQPAVKTVTHTSAVYLIDDEGRERIFFGDDFTVTQLATDLKVLLNED